MTNRRSDFSIVIPWRPSLPTRQANLSYIFNRLQADLPNVPVLLQDSTPGQPFNPSEARNFGVRRTTTDVVVIVDADVWVPTVQLLEAVDIVHGSREYMWGRQENWIIPYTHYCKHSQESTRLILSSRLSIESAEPEIMHPRRSEPKQSTSSCLVMDRELYFKVGGHDGRFQGGYEDHAIVLALETLSQNEVEGRAIRLGGSLYHLYHDESLGLQAQKYINTHNTALYARYKAAFQQPAMMQALCDEHKDWLK